jgi:hypothetical protein
MTALSEYQRLECPGLWREAPDSQRREVMVAFGDATLVIREMPSERALTHWSLPAAIRVNPGRMPAVFSPDPDTGEELEIDDETMIAAITKVHSIIAARQPHPGRLRGALLWSIAAVMAAAALLWLPGALINHTAKVLPASTRKEIGLAILSDLQRLTGSPCTAPDGSLALQELGRKLLGGTGGQILVLPEGLDGSLHLPGNLIAIGRRLIEDHDSPDAAAGFVLAERLRAEAADPVPAALRYAGLRAAFHLLTTGDVPVEAFRGYGETLLTAPEQPVPAGTLLERFRAAGVGSAAYARAAHAEEAQPELIKADPFAATPPPAPLLDDTDWVALQGICAG